MSVPYNFPGILTEISLKITRFLKISFPGILSEFSTKISGILSEISNFLTLFNFFYKNIFKFSRLKLNSRE